MIIPRSNIRLEPKKMEFADSCGLSIRITDTPVPNFLSFNIIQNHNAEDIVILFTDISLRITNDWKNFQRINEAWSKFLTGDRDEIGTIYEAIVSSMDLLIIRANSSFDFYLTMRMPKNSHESIIDMNRATNKGTRVLGENWISNC